MNGSATALSPRVLSLSPALARRVALARRHLPTNPTNPTTSANSRCLTTSSPLLASKPRATSIPPLTALSALLSRLSLPPSATLHPALLACLTHPSYVAASEAEGEGETPELEIVSEGGASSSSAITPELAEGENNEVLAALGNSLLGLFASEHLSALYPLLPTSALSSAITAYVGPASCLSIARELGVSVQGGGNSGVVGQGAGSQSAGVPVRWSRINIAEKYWEEKKGRIHTQRDQPETVPVARRFQKFAPKAASSEDGAASVDVDAETGVERGDRRRKKDTFENVIADTVRAFVGLIYQEQGIHAARAFTHAHFLSRALDLSTLITPKNPMHMLTSVVQKHLSDAGVPISANQGMIESRILASTGVASQSPLFLIGLFLPSGIKLAEGHGSSKAMAQHRAAVNALQSLFLVRGDQPSALASLGIPSRGSNSVVGPFGQGLPTSAHASRLFDETHLVSSTEEETAYVGVEWGGKDVVAQSANMNARKRRV